jgi:hypothetical protein
MQVFRKFFPIQRLLHYYFFVYSNTHHYPHKPMITTHCENMRPKYLLIAKIATFNILKIDLFHNSIFHKTE